MLVQHGCIGLPRARAGCLVGNRDQRYDSMEWHLAWERPRCSERAPCALERGACKPILAPRHAKRPRTGHGRERRKTARNPFSWNGHPRNSQRMLICTNLRKKRLWKRTSKKARMTTSLVETPRPSGCTSHKRTGQKTASLGGLWPIPLCGLN